MNNRNAEIDITKGMLTIGMIFAHMVSFLYNQQSSILVAIKHGIIDLVSFPGFLFCFGFASWVAYYQKNNIPWMKIIKTAFKCYFAFVISGVAWRVIVPSEKTGINVFTNIILIRDMPLLSEFLLTFALITIMGALFYKQITILTRRWLYLILATSICLAFTFLPQSDQYDPLISVFIGGGKYQSFPLIQYLPLFLLGIFAARNPDWFNLRLYLIASYVGCGIWLAFMFSNIPLTEFPPSASWIMSSVGFLSLICVVANLFSVKFPKLITRYLNVVGQNVLVYLLLSNLSIIIGIALGLDKKLNEFQLLLFFTSILVFIFFIQFISIDLNKANQSLDKKV